MISILVIDDETKMTILIEGALTDAGFRVTTSNYPKKALELIEKHSYDIIVTDLSMPGTDGMKVLEKARQKGDAEVIIMTAYGTVESAVEAMKKGAADYIMKPFPMDELIILCTKIEKQQKMSGLNRLLADDLKAVSSDKFVGSSEKSRQMLDMIAKVAATDTTVLLVGKSGTGKELAAHLVHDNSPRQDQPFIAVNCAALTETLLESELFGHEKGAFTGAVKRKLGRFELADKGSIFLDEIGEMSPNLQSKLLRVLEERQFMRVGGIDNVEIDVRLIAATNRNLKEEIKNGRFREDLYFRLNVFPIEMPSLYEKIEDIPELAEYFLKRQNYHETTLSKDVILKLQSYSWPGNIRELKNILERAMILAGDNSIDISHIGIDENKDSETSITNSTNVINGLESAEKKMIIDALSMAGGNKTEAARLLKITRRRFYSRLKYHKIM